MADLICEASFELDVDARKISVDDPKVTGRQIRSAAGLNPASSYVLILFDDAGAQSIGLDREVDLTIFGDAVFRSFKSDRVFSMTLNERGFAWGAPEISEPELREYGQIPEDHELVLDSQGDRVLEPDDTVNLNRKGVERIVSRPAEELEICIIVNARRKIIKVRRLTFEKLIALAFANPPTGENICFTVTYRNGPRNRPEGSLVEGDRVRIKKGMVFNVTSTDKS